MGDSLVNHVRVVPRRSAEGLVAEVYGQVGREIGRHVEGVSMFSADSAVLAASWASFREPLLAAGRAPRMDKEAVAATVARLNECPYCVDAHSVMLYGGGAGTVATQLLGGLAAEQVHPDYRDLCRWAEDASAQGTAATAVAPFPADRAPELIGVLVNFHFLTRMITILLDGTFLPGSERAKRIARRVGGKVMAGRITARLEPGLAPGVRRGLPLPADLAWAAGSEPVSAAFAMLAAVCESAAHRAAPPAAIEAVEQGVAAWAGGFPGIGASWVNEPLSRLSPPDRPAARLGLLAALAPHQVTVADVNVYRADHPGDRDLLGLLSWSTFLAARKVGTWARSTCVSPV